MKKEKKGQMSLETAVGFVILIVVAAVVVTLVINVLPSSAEEEVAGQITDIQTIKGQCRTKCQNWKTSSGLASTSSAIEYCIQRFNYDENSDGSLSQVAGSGFNSYCEDGVHCFNLHTCRNDYEELDAAKCRELMCQYYQNPKVAGSDASKEKAGEWVYKFFEPGRADKNVGAGTCEIGSVKDATGTTVNTWWNEYFEPDSVGGNKDYSSICEGVEAPAGSGGTTDPGTGGSGEEGGTGEGGGSGEDDGGAGPELPEEFLN